MFLNTPPERIGFVMRRIARWKRCQIAALNKADLDPLNGKSKGCCLSCGQSPWRGDIYFRP
jgi:hypothetical protein